MKDNKIKLVITMTKWVDPDDLSYEFNDYGAECDTIEDYIQSMKKSLYCEKFDNVKIIRFIEE